jgi:hypothetical protein
VSTDSAELEQYLTNTAITDEVAMFARVLDIEVTMDDGPNPAVFEIMSAILKADTEDDIFAAANAGVISGKDFIDIPFRLRAEDIQWKKSAAAYRENNGFPYYILMRPTDLVTGERLVVSCGGSTFCTTIFRLGKKGHFADYEAEGGMPLYIKAKPVGLGAVLILQKYALPKTHAPGKTAK